MAQNHTNQPSSDKEAIRPALIVAPGDVRNYSALIRRIFVGLATEGCFSALVCNSDASGISKVNPLTEFIVYPMLRSPLFFIQNRKILLQKLTDFKPTVLHCLSPARYRLTRCLAHRLGVPFVLTFDSTGPVPFHLRKPMRTCQALIAPSKPIAEYLRRGSRHYAASVKQINIGAFVNDSVACFANPNRIPSMVIAQRLENSAAFGPFLNAIKHLAIDGCEFIVVIIGKGPAQRQIYKKIKQMGLSNTITLLNRIGHLHLALAGADIFVQVQKRNAFNLRLLEAMAAGLAVASCRDGIDGLVIDTQTAATFDPDDELSIYSCLQKLLGRRELAQQLAINAQTHIKKHYSVSKMTNALLETYADVQKRFTQP